MNDDENAVIKGLQSHRKYLPNAFRYDKQGSIYYDMCLENDEFNYFNQSQVNVLSQNVEELVSEMKMPCVLVDMGSGNAAKTKIFIDVLLQKQAQLTYIPVDISAQHLEDTSESLTNIYGNKLNVQPVAGQYEKGFEYIRTIAENKLILWFNSINNLPFDTQPRMLSLLSDVMQANDKLLITLDVTQDKKQIETTYGGPAECFIGVITNGLGRLNRDYGANISLETFKLRAEFIRSTSAIYPSYVTTRVVSTKDQTINIPGLGITVCFKAGESLMLHEGEGFSCKYNEEQIKSLAERGHLRLDKLFVDQGKHCALCCLIKQYDN